MSFNDSARQEQQRRESQRLQREAQRQAQEGFRRLQRNSRGSFKRGQDALAHQRVRASHRRRSAETQGQRPLPLPGDDIPTTTSRRPSRRHWTRRMLILACLALVAAGGIYIGLWSGGIADGGLRAIVGSDSAWNLRAGPSTNSPVLGQVQPGEQVMIDCLEGSWAKLIAPREGAFVNSRGLSYQEKPPPC
jgi:hypothetical protein